MPSYLKLSFIIIFDIIQIIKTQKRAALKGEVAEENEEGEQREETQRP